MSLSTEMTGMKSDTRGPDCISGSVFISFYLSRSPFLHTLVRCVVLTCESALSRYAKMIAGVRMSTNARLTDIHCHT